MLLCVCVCVCGGGGGSDKNMLPISGPLGLDPQIVPSSRRGRHFHFLMASVVCLLGFHSLAPRTVQCRSCLRNGWERFPEIVARITQFWVYLFSSLHLLLTPYSDLCSAFASGKCSSLQLLLCHLLLCLLLLCLLLCHFLWL